MLEYVSANPHLLWLSLSVKFVVATVGFLAAIHKRFALQIPDTPWTFHEDWEYLKRIGQATEEQRN